MSVQRPAKEDIESRAAAMKEETEAYPEDTRSRLLAIKKAALQSLVDDYDGNLEIVASHYPGWEKADLEALLGML